MGSCIPHDCGAAAPAIVPIAHKATAAADYRRTTLLSACQTGIFESSSPSPHFRFEELRDSASSTSRLVQNDRTVFGKVILELGALHNFREFSSQLSDHIMGGLRRCYHRDPSQRVISGESRF